MLDGPGPKVSRPDRFQFQWWILIFKNENFLRWFIFFALSAAVVFESPFEHCVLTIDFD